MCRIQYTETFEKSRDLLILTLHKEILDRVYFLKRRTFTLQVAVVSPMAGTAPVVLKHC